MRQGQTRYSYIVMQFEADHETKVDLNLQENDMKQFKLDKTLEGKASYIEAYSHTSTRATFVNECPLGKTYNVISRLFGSLVNRSIVVPGDFKSEKGDSAISCTYKATSGHLFPLNRSFLFIVKPVIFIRWVLLPTLAIKLAPVPVDWAALTNAMLFEDIVSVEFSRTGVTTQNRFFAILVSMRGAIEYEFTNIDKSEYKFLYDYLISKQVKVVNAEDTERHERQTFASGVCISQCTFVAWKQAHERNVQTAMASEVLDVDRKEVKRTGKLTVSRKRAAVELGYYEDEFVHVFGETYNQIPIVSLTYVHRVFSSRMISDLFVESFNGKPVQFVNLGGGLDTLCFYLLKKHPNVICFDTDLETQVKLKCELMAGHQIFTDLLPDLKLENGFYSSSRYKMFPLDLTRIEDFQRLLDAGFSKDLPTLFFAECVFMYIDPDVLNEVGHDGYFTKALVEKYKEHKLKLSAFQRYRTPEDIKQRFKDLGWELVSATRGTTFWNLLPESERKRVLNLQSFNEFEGLGLHYGYGFCCVASNKYDNPALHKTIFTDGMKANEESELHLEDIDYHLKRTSPSFNKQFFDRFFSELWIKVCVELGYYDDEFIEFFADPATQSSLLSIVHHIRTVSIRMVADLFVESFNGKPVQFVNLGGGLDTLCFYLLKKHPNVICFDTDLETQVKLKCELMAGHQIFTDLLPDLKLENGFYSSSRYKMFPLDLTRIEDFQRLLDAGFSKDLPTMYIAEFSSMYVEAEPMNKFLKFLNEFSNDDSVYFFTEAHFVSNSLGCAVYRTLESQIKRYEDLSWKLKLVSYNDFYNHNFETEEKKRILKLEDFKEMDELGTACSHMISGLCYKSDRNLSKVLNLFRTYDNHTNLNYYDMPYGINFSKPDFDKALFRHPELREINRRRDHDRRNKQLFRKTIAQKAWELPFSKIWIYIISK
ncbi:structure-specific recognition protein 1 [Theileria orientalis strain Shintoku]|uniref:[phosphatase 2A protein]-leucine-carboxy methyltransferase n=1 Tax=Theileria orientalis strain Shintoku TaxID=869250 RepID=J7MF35_THEOR|nr:LOW QUALITY PROTEIN: structure-specific recognition protein 1 [Theileria orientalis strain Shintoku]BAM42404.1 structure-specific recognition protein 1 [Theileria orientalis strain Shintoku]|eukprot:XP_009692705.1 LOW QUALITY PROTEIN: structure-specific recognition protein 1 [Theileria orientalis strain Shintoku]